MDSKKSEIEKLVVDLPPVPNGRMAEQQRSPGRENTLSECSKKSNQDLKSCLRRMGASKIPAKDIVKKVIFSNINMRPYDLTACEMVWKMVPRVLQPVKIKGRYIRDFSQRETLLRNFSAAHTEEIEALSPTNSQSSTSSSGSTSEDSSGSCPSEFPRVAPGVMSRIPVRRQPSQTHQQELLYERVEDRVISPHRSGRQLMSNRLREVKRPPMRSGSSLEGYRPHRPSTEDNRSNDFAGDCRRNGSAAEDVRRPRKRKSLTKLTKVNSYSKTTNSGTNISSLASSLSDEASNITSHTSSAHVSGTLPSDNTNSQTEFPAGILRKQGSRTQDTFSSSDDISALLDSAMELAETHSQDDVILTSQSPSATSQESLERIIKEILDDVTPPQTSRRGDNSRKPHKIVTESKSSALPRKPVNSPFQSPCCLSESHIPTGGYNNLYNEPAPEHNLNTLWRQRNTSSCLEDGGACLDPGGEASPDNILKCPTGGNSDESGTDLLGESLSCQRECGEIQKCRGSTTIESSKRTTEEGHCKPMQDCQRSGPSPSNGEGVCLDSQDECHVQANTKLWRGKQFFNSVWRSLSSFKRRIKSVNCFSNSVE